MNGKADRRRPLFVAVVLTVAIGVALVAPVIIGARRGEPIPGSTVRADSRERFTISTPQTLFSSPSVTLDRGTVALVGPDTQESSFRAALRALLTGGGADLVLDGAKLTIDRRATGDAPAPANAPAATGLPEELGSIIAALSDFKFRSLTLLDSKIVVRTVQGGAQTISVLNAEIASDAHGLVKANGRLEFRGEPLNFEAAFTRPDGKPDAPVKVRAAVNGKYVTASFDGRLANDHRQITAQNGELSVSDLRGFASWLGASWPLGSGLGLFTAKGQLTLDERAISFEHAQVTLDGNAATGALTAKIGAERPSIEGTLAFATFDVAPYTTPSRPYALALAVDWLSGLRIPGLSAPSFLRETDADIRISAGNVVSGGDRLGRGAISLSVKEGKLYGEIAELDLEHGGNGEGQFTLDMTGAEPLYTIRAELNDIDLATVVAPRLGPSIVDGAGDIRLNLNARGTSEADVMGSLAGTLSLEMNEGGRVGIDLDALSPMVTASPAASDGWGAAAMGSTTVSSFTARFTAVAGVLTANTIEATTENRTVTAAGTVDVDKNALDLVLSIAPAAGTAEAPAGAFKIQGPWSAPAISRTEPGKSAQTKPSGSDPG